MMVPGNKGNKECRIPNVLPIHKEFSHLSLSLVPTYMLLLPPQLSPVIFFYGGRMNFEGEVVNKIVN